MIDCRMEELSIGDRVADYANNLGTTIDIRTEYILIKWDNEDSVKNGYDFEDIIFLEIKKLTPLEQLL